jgi:hypothetical protein
MRIDRSGKAPSQKKGELTKNRVFCAGPFSDCIEYAILMSGVLSKRPAARMAGFRTFLDSLNRSGWI